MQLYKKQGRKYIPVGYEDGFAGFPSEGIWIVYNRPGVKSESCIASVGKFKNIDYSQLGSLIAEKEDKCLERASIIASGQCSLQDIVRGVLEALLENE